jgi:DNA-binding beta-propeller fold protein YncE
MLTLLCAPTPAPAVITTNGANAISELGQDDGTFAGNLTYAFGAVWGGSAMTSTNDTANALGFSATNIGGFALDSTNHRLFIADTSNNRILVFNLNSSNMLTSMIANNVLGQPNFRLIWTNGDAGNSAANTLSSPVGLAFDATNNRLFAADSSNSRVLVYSTTTITNGMNASYELGQASGANAFVFNSSNRGGSPSQSSLSNPKGIAFDSANELLYVGDANNNRVMVFNVATGSIANGENASYELGQASGSAYTANSANQGGSASSSSLSAPRDVAFDSTDDLLYVGDTTNNRVMVFPTASAGGPFSGNGEAASHELGQPSGTAFTSTTAATSVSGLSGPSGVAYDSTNGRLFVIDSNNNRVMVFSTGSIANGESASYELGQASGGSAFTTATAATTQSGLSGRADGILYDSANTLLYVADYANAREMIFNVATGTIANGENASNELGQDDGTFAGNVSYTQSGANDSPNAVGFGSGEQDGIAIDSTNHRLFVGDQSNNRVLVFNLNNDNSINSMIASKVLGQANFRASAAATTQAGMSAPAGIAFDAVNNRLFVTDSTNNRVLVYSTSTITNGMNASYELGQPSGGSEFTSGSTATTQSGMSAPRQIVFDPTNELLYVAERGNNRVTVWNVAPGSIADGENASYELGQASGGSAFTAGSANRGGSAGQSTLSNPQGVALDVTNQLLFVAERGNNRVTVFNVAPAHIANGENASYELGQPSGTAFTTTAAATTQSGFSQPIGLAFDGNSDRLFVTDDVNNRVLVFNVGPGVIANGENASYELGQPSGGTAFTTATAATSQSGLDVVITYPTYCPCNGNLYVKDGNNNRVMIFPTQSMPAWSSTAP